MVMNKTTTFAFPVPAYDYGDGGETTAVAEFTSSMSAAASAVLAAIDATSNALSVAIAGRVAAFDIVSNNISVVSAAVVRYGNANVVSAQLISVNAALQTGIDTVSNAISNEISVRTVSVGAANTAANAVSVALAAAIVDRVSSLNVVSVLVNPMSVSANLLSNKVSTLSVAAIVIKAINTGNQNSVSASVPVTVSGVSLPVVTGGSYYFQFNIPYSHKNLAGGLTVQVAGPAMTSFISRVGIPTGGTGVATTYTFGIIGTIGGIVSSISNALSGTSSILIAEGFANPSADGALHIGVGIAVAGTAATVMVLKGATGRAWKLS